MKIRRASANLIAAGLLAVAGVGVAAQDAEPEPRAVPYARGVAGEVPETIPGLQTRTEDGQVRIHGLQLLDIPVRFTDARISGRLTIFSNGTGRDFADGHARIEPRTYRIDNEDGSWAGSGERVLAISIRQPRPLLNHESMLLFGDGAYAGLVAYVFIELANGAPELEAVVLDVDMAPLPDAVPPRDRFDVSGPRGPASGPMARPVETHDG